MIFSIVRKGEDGTGIDAETRYVEADSLKRAWRKIGQPFVHTYWIGRREVYFERTPEGKGFGIWEPNPKFDFERDIGRVTKFAFSGGRFETTCVEPIKVRR